MLYTCESYSTALLEKLVHSNTGQIPSTQVSVMLHLPSGCQVAEPDEGGLGDWLHHEAWTQDIGDEWIAGRQTLALRVPSIVARPYEHNLLLNPRHPDFARLVWSEPLPVQWDQRIFGSAEG